MARHLFSALFFRSCNRVEARLSRVTHPKARELEEDERKGQAAEAGAVFRNRIGWLSGLNP
jgi:hypothetical protein